MLNQSLRNKNPHRNPIQIIAYRNSNWKNTAPVIAKVSKCFRVNLWQMRTKKVFLGKPYNYAYFDFAVCFLIGGRSTLDYDVNMALLKVNRHLTLLRIQHYNHPGLQGIPLY